MPCIELRDYIFLYLLRFSARIQGSRFDAKPRRSLLLRMLRISRDENYFVLSAVEMVTDDDLVAVAIESTLRLRNKQLIIGFQLYADQPMY